MIDRLDRAGLSPVKLEAVVDALREFYAWAIDEGLVDFDPSDSLIVSREQAEPAGSPSAPEGMVPDHVIWLSLKVATVAFVLIALILVAESV